MLQPCCGHVQRLKHDPLPLPFPLSFFFLYKILYIIWNHYKISCRVSSKIKYVIKLRSLINYKNLSFESFELVKFWLPSPRQKPTKQIHHKYDVCYSGVRPTASGRRAGDPQELCRGGLCRGQSPDESSARYGVLVKWHYRNCFSGEKTWNMKRKRFDWLRQVDCDFREEVLNYCLP